jgi:hypothetical protein
MRHVKEYRIRNEHVPNHLQVPDILATIKRRQFNTLGNFARMPLTRLPRKFVTAWVSKTRRIGRPFNTLRNSYVGALSEIMGPQILTSGGALKNWHSQVTEKKEWEQLAADWLKKNTQSTARLYGLHPLLGCQQRSTVLPQPLHPHPIPPVGG